MICLPIPDLPERKLGSKLITFLSRMKHWRAILGARATKAAVLFKPNSRRAR